MKNSTPGKPDINTSSPLVPKPFPFQMSMLQTSAASTRAVSNLPPPTTISEFKFTNAPSPVPDLFHLNDRAQLIFDSEEEDEDEKYASFDKSLVIQEHEVQKWQTGRKEKDGQKRQEASPIKIQQKQVKKIEQSNKIDITISKAEPPKMQEIVIAKSYNLNRFPKTSIVQDASERNECNANQKADIKKDSKNIDKDMSQVNNSGMKQLSVQKLNQQDKLSESAASKTSQVIEKMKIQHRQDKDVIMEIVVEDKEKSSSSQQQNQQEMPIQKRDKPKEEEKDSQRSFAQENPFNISSNNKRKRNRIFDSSSIKRTKDLSRTPEKIKQGEVQPFKLNTERENRDLSPQVKALTVLDKIVDQMGSNNQTFSKIPAKRMTWLSDLSDFLESLQQDLKVINRICHIENILQQNILKRHLQTKQKTKIWRQRATFQMRKAVQYSSQSDLQFDLRERLIRLEEIVDSTDIVIQNYLQTKERLAALEDRIKDMMVILAKGELSKIYTLLGQVSQQIERLKQLKKSIGKHKLEKMLEEFLQYEIAQLEQVQSEMRTNFNSGVLKLKR